jgi:hypothetical protein
MSKEEQNELATLRYLANSFDFLRLKAWADWLDESTPLAVDFLAHCLVNFRSSNSQILQDLFVDFVLSKNNGIFVEFGATNGVLRSNTLFLERSRYWTGLLAEPAKCWHTELNRNRPDCKIDTRCVWKNTGETITFRETEDGELSTIDMLSAVDKHSASRNSFRSQYPVNTVSLNDLLYFYLESKKLDYLSIDTEGSELDIISTFDIERFRPRIVTIEHNHTSLRQGIFDIFTSAGYIRVFENLSTIDDWYVDLDTWSSLTSRLGNQSR